MGVQVVVPVQVAEPEVYAVPVSTGSETVTFFAAALPVLVSAMV